MNEIVALYRESRRLHLRHCSDADLAWELEAIVAELHQRHPAAPERELAGVDDAIARAALEARKRA